MPRVFDLPISSRNEATPDQGLAVGLNEWDPILAHNESTVHPAGMLAPAGEAKGSIKPPAIPHRLGLTAGPKRAGEDHIRPVSIDSVVSLRRQKSRHHTDPTADRCD